MQDMVGGDNNRTPVVFQVPDIYNIVGGIVGFLNTDSAGLYLVDAIHFALDG